MSIYEPYKPEDFGWRPGSRDHDMVNCTRAAEIANAKFNAVIDGWAPNHIMVMIEAAKNELETRVRQLEKELDALNGLFEPTKGERR